MRHEGSEGFLRRRAKSLVRSCCRTKIGTILIAHCAIRNLRTCNLSQGKPRSRPLLLGQHEDP